MATVNLTAPNGIIRDINTELVLSVFNSAIYLNNKKIAEVLSGSPGALVRMQGQTGPISVLETKDRVLELRRLAG